MADRDKEPSAAEKAVEKEASGEPGRRVLSGVEARQGVKLGVMRYVLVISIGLVIVGFIVAYLAR
ncbi:MAG TPA: hypothetical protein VFA23_02820 [Dongiaceae bacterium]|nr:hypothetical protein [Dongiaceae bacterium]